MNAIDRIITQSHHLTESDKIILSYILENLDEIPYMSSRLLAKNTFTTATSIHRFIKKLGFKDYSDFKYRIVTMLKDIKMESTSITNNEDLLTVVSKINSLEIDSITKTKNKLNISELKEISELLINTKYIDIIANDTNATIAEYASHMLGCLGKIVTVYKYTDKQLQYCLNVDPTHICIFVSKHAKDNCMIDCIDILNNKNINTIAITSKRKNALSIRCKYCLEVHFDFDRSNNEIDFYIGLKYIFDLLYGILLTNNYDKTQKMEQIHNQLFSHLL